MSLNPDFFALYYLQQAFIDKQTGLQLQGGVLYSWQDNNRNNPKPLYQITGAPPNYTYTALPNPLTLSNAGTVVDASGNDIDLYAYPFDLNGDPDNYYLQVFNTPSVPPYPPVGTPMLTRENIPGVVAGIGETTSGPQSFDNAITNSQFAQVLFNPANGLTVTYTSGTTTVQFAPGWYVQIVASNSGTLTLNRVSLSGIANNATQPPYAISVSPGANITELIVYQQLNNNPNIWASAPPGSAAYISAGIALAPSTGQVSIYYAPQGIIQNSTTNPWILQASNGLGIWKYFSNNAGFGQGTNANTADNGYTQIQILLPNSGTTIFSSVQIVGLYTDDLIEKLQNLPYAQVPVNQQISQNLFYYEPQIFYKPIPSYLVGWDFPKNPAQLGTTVSAFSGANGSQYFWDQTIVYQSVTNGVTGAAGGSGELVLTANATTQLAVIQYLGLAEVQEILSGNVSVNVEGFTTQGGGIQGTVSLWVSDGTALPVITGGGKPSIVGGLNATGFPNSLNQCTGNTVGWTQITRQNQNTGLFTLGIARTNAASQYNDIALNSYGLNNVGALTSATAKFFAIVVGFASLAHTDTIVLASISLVPGDIATRPAPLTAAQTILNCQQFYWKTFPQGVNPAQSIGLLSGEYLYTAGKATNANNNQSPSIFFPVSMRAVPSVITYSPAAATNAVYDETVPGTCSATLPAQITTNSMNINCTGNASTAVGNLLGVHITADARFGVV